MTFHQRTRRRSRYAGLTLHPWCVSATPALKNLITIANVVVLQSCAGAGSYVWIDDVSDSELRVAQTVQVSVGDNISVRVFGQEPLSTRATVRADGMFSVPLIGQVRVAGRHPEEISKEVAKRLEPYVNGPHVLTSIEESHLRVILAGEIRRPGTLVTDGPIDLLTAIANAGGITEFASESSIFVLRSTPAGINRIRFRWEEVSRGVGKAALFRLRDNDEVVVE